MSAGEEQRADEISRLLAAAEAGEPVDMEALLPLVYDQLRRIAQRQMNTERSGHTLQATALVHEAYLKLVGAGLSWKSKSHFYRAAAEAMRRILVDHARSQGRAKRGGGRQRVAVNLADLVANSSPAEFLAVDEAIRRFKEAEPRAGSIAHLRLYAGLSIAETAEALEIPQRTVERDWSYARTWLYEKLR
jgi:RNA polymerase sigma factor (TIGR02999 family)